LTGIKTKFLVSSKKCNKSIKEFSSNLYPYELNVLHNLTHHQSGNYFSLGEVKDFEDGLQFQRRIIDIKRTFYDGWLLTASGREEIRRTYEYKLGKLLLKPVRLFKKIFNSKAK
jgi:hypothetical protein